MLGKDDSSLKHSGIGNNSFPLFGPDTEPVQNDRHCVLSRPIHYQALVVMNSVLSCAKSLSRQAMSRPVTDSGTILLVP